MAAEKLVIGIVTRGRKDLVEWTAKETLKNCRADTKVIVLADHDDRVDFDLPKEIIVSVEQREDSVGGKWNRMLNYDADVYLAMCDYRAQITPGFDKNILEASKVFPDGIGCVYQHLANLSFPCYQAMTKKMAQIMGHFYPTYFPYWFVDHWLDDISKMSGRYVLSKGETELKPRPGNGSTQEFREPSLWATLYDGLYKEREEIVERLFSFMDEPEWKKDQLRMNFGLIHHRSRMINDFVRQMQGNAPFDDRYSRIREKGTQKLLEIYENMRGA